VAVFENRMQRMLGLRKVPKKTCKKVHNEELHNMYPQNRSISVVKSRRTRWVEK
jgi:hypothetical protein